MFRCFWIKRSLGEYLEGALGGSAKSLLEAHLKKCAGCQKTLLHLETVARLASQKKTPEMSEEFWKKFELDLNAKIDEKLGAVFSARKHPFFAPIPILRRPVFVMVSLAVITLAIGLNILVQDRYAASVKLARSDEASLINEVELLDEVSRENGVVSSQEEDDAAEIYMLYLLDPVSIEQMG